MKACVKILMGRSQSIGCLAGCAVSRNPTRIQRKETAASAAAVHSGVAKSNHGSMIRSDRTPPMTGPSTMPTESASVSRLMLRARWDSEERSDTAAWAIGWLPAMRPDRKRPNSNRDTLRSSIPAAIMAVARLKPPMQMSSTGLRPKRSERSPSIEAPKNMPAG